MQRIIKIAAPVLGFVLILVLVLGLAACGGGQDAESNNNLPVQAADENAAESDAGEIIDDGLFYDEIPELDFGGYEYRVLVGTYNLRNETLYPESDIGEILNDTIYRRNKNIEDRFNIKYKATVIDLFQLLATLRKNGRAGDDAYDMYMQIDREAHTAAAENLLYPLDELPYIDLTRPYWCPIPNKQLTIGGKLYWAFSDDMLSFLESTVVTYFNKKMVQDLGIEDLYGLVRSGAWTHDKFFEYAISAVRDIDGDGQITEADYWGIASEHYYIAQSFWVSAGIRSVDKDENDLPYFAIPGNQKFFDMAEKAVAALTFKDGVFIESIEGKLAGYSAGKTPLGSYAGNSFMERRLTFFKSGHCLFSVGAIPEMIDLRDMPDDFGIIPFPKYTADQTQYYSSVCGGFPFVTPITNKRPEIAGAVMEAMACSARNEIIPAYYESALKTKYSRDTDTAEMLDLIFDTRVYDLGCTIWSAPGTDYTYAFAGGSNTFASITEKNEEKYNQIMQKAVEAMLKGPGE